MSSIFTFQMMLEGRGIQVMGKNDSKVIVAAITDESEHITKFINIIFIEIGNGM